MGNNEYCPKLFAWFFKTLYYSITFPPLSIARYSFIHQSELGRCGENEIAKTAAKG